MSSLKSLMDRFKVPSEKRFSREHYGENIDLREVRKEESILLKEFGELVEKEFIF